jgi:hypothetical protein
MVDVRLFCRSEYYQSLQGKTDEQMPFLIWMKNQFFMLFVYISKIVLI